MTLLEQMKGKTLPGKNPDDLPLAVRARIFLREEGAKAFATGYFGDAEALAGLYRAVAGREVAPIKQDDWDDIFYTDSKGEDRMSTIFSTHLTGSFMEILDAIRADEITRATTTPEA